MASRIASLGEALTARETVVCDHLSAGLSNKEIAQALHISPRTIEVHRARIFIKLGVRNAVELVRLLLTPGQ